MGEPEQTTTWEGVRNSEASNYLRLMKLGDIGIFYHSNCKVPGMVAIVKIVREAYPDETQFDAGNPYYDYRSSLDKPRWCAVDVKFVRLLKRPLSLAEIRLHHGEHVKNDGPLKNLMLIKRVRLSIQPLNKEEYQFILELEQQM
jgi:predicted RNA-binding protein with PUA-like domain